MGSGSGKEVKGHSEKGIEERLWLICNILEKNKKGRINKECL